MEAILGEDTYHDSMSQRRRPECDGSSAQGWLSVWNISPGEAKPQGNRAAVFRHQEELLSELEEKSGCFLLRGVLKDRPRTSGRGWGSWLGFNHRKILSVIRAASKWAALQGV